MLARTRVIRCARRHAVEFRCRKTPRQALAELPLPLAELPLRNLAKRAGNDPAPVRSQATRH
jgi:hypothetical protein